MANVAACLASGDEPKMSKSSEVVSAVAGSDGPKTDTRYTARAIFKVKSEVFQNPKLYFDRIVAEKYNIFMHDPTGIMEFNLGDHQCLQFIEDDGSAACIFDQSEGYKKLQCEVQFVDADVGRVPSSLKNVFGRHQQEILVGENMLREKSLKEMRLLKDRSLKHKRI